jgi:hypothetical protein
VSIARFILVALICAAPAILLWDGLIMQGLLAAAIAVALAVTGLTLRPGETEFLISVILPAAAAATVPAVWILFQVVPLRPLANPIWASTQSALGHTVTSTISIDPGMSVTALGQYVLLCAAAFVSAAIAVDRRRAEALLFALTAAEIMIALLLLTHDLFLAKLSFSPFTRGQAIDSLAVGTIIAAAACIRNLERYEIRAGNPQQSKSIAIWTFMACGVAFVICAAALLLDATREVLVATGFGLAALACVLLIRRFGLGAWSLTAFALPLIAVAVFSFTNYPAQRGRGLLLMFATPSSTSLTSISDRMLEDAPVLGTGVGTFESAAQIYREMDDPPPGPVAATAVATWAIELGRPVLWLIVAATIGYIVIFLKASLQRGRDSFYSAMGGSALVTLLMLSFINTGLLGNAPGLIVAVVFGASVAQSKSRTIQH